MPQLPPRTWPRSPSGKPSNLIRSKGASPVELTQACLKQIERYNSKLNAFITVVPEQAIAAAREMEAEQQRGKWQGPLHGVPIALKDNIDTAGVHSTGASELFKDRVPSEDAEVARRLENAGRHPARQVNLHEFAYGGSSTTTAYGTMHEPVGTRPRHRRIVRRTWSRRRHGSSFLARDRCRRSSVRMPTAHCGIVGLKPTYGRVSTRGVMTLSWTLDHVGPMCGASKISR